jgi:hypothetical protein
MVGAVLNEGDGSALEAKDLGPALLQCDPDLYDTSKKTWRIEGGRDLDGDDLTVVLVLEDDHGRLVTTF